MTRPLPAGPVLASRSAAHAGLASLAAMALVTASGCTGGAIVGSPACNRGTPGCPSYGEDTETPLPQTGDTAPDPTGDTAVGPTGDTAGGTGDTGAPPETGDTADTGS